MIIKKYILENFGIYHKENKFNLQPNSNKENIILIGGENGNGKTTFFNGLILCLYGIKSFDKVISEKEYKIFLKEKIHDNPNLTITEKNASVSLEFEHTTQSVTDIYFIKRAWKLDDEEIVKEEFIVHKNGKALKNLESDNWQDFINDLIPKGLTQLFFFDGEKILNLAQDNNDSKELSNSFKALLGLELVEKLNSDLEIYLNRQLKIESKNDLSITLNAKKEELDKKEKEIEKINQDKSFIINKLDKCKKEIEILEEKIRKEGGQFSENRDNLKTKINEYETEIKILEEKLRVECYNKLPFLFSKNILLRLGKDLFNEAQVNENNIANKIIHNRLENAKKCLNDEINEELLNKLKEILIIEDKISIQHHNLSKNNTIKVLGIIDEIKNKETDFLEDFSKEHNRYSKKLLITQKELSYAADDEVIEPLVKKINELNKNLGSIEFELEKKDENLKELYIEKSKLEKEYLNIRSQIKDNTNLSIKIKRIEKTLVVLDEYYNELKNNKINEFCDVFIGYFNKIIRKENSYEAIELDPNNYQVTLIKKDSSGNIFRIPKKKLSEGEKQMYALSVLWTLTKISGKELPFIIDTPLGRLDHNHRTKLIENFFPQISKQLVILSTDTEIDDKYYKMLKKNITRTYLLKENKGRTLIKEGYF